MSEEVPGDNMNGDNISDEKLPETQTQTSSKSPSEQRLQQARTRFNQLPLDAVPEPDPGTLADVSRVVHTYNPYFVGRQDAFRAVAKALSNNEPIIITGIAGVGKTQLAAEFAHRYGRYFPGGVFWLSFGDPTAIPAEIAACGRNMELPGLYELDIDQQVEMVLSEWQEPLPRLLIFDNCEHEALFDQYRPKTGGARLLVTSRRGRWSSTLGAATMPLHQLNRSESIQFLQQFLQPLTGSDTTDAANAIAAALGDLPLALHLAGSYLAFYEGAVTPTEFLSELEKAGPFHESLAGEFEGHSPTEHERDMARTFELSYERLVQTDNPLAHRILLHLTHLAPGETIPFNLLLATFGPADQRPDDKEIIVARRRLLSLGLVTPEEDRALRLHRLLHHFVRRVAEQDTQAQTQIAVEKGVAAQAQELINTGYPAPLLPWQNHLRYLADAALPRRDEQAAALAGQVGYYLMMIADYNNAGPYLEQSVAIRENILGANHPDTAASLNMLGMLFQAVGRLDQAKTHYQRALAIWEETLGPNHHDTATSLNNLGALYREMGDLEAAKSCYERALAIDKQVLGHNHPDTAICLNNLGTLLRDMGDLDAAKPKLEQALAIWEQTHGPDHPDTAYSVSNLGHLLKEMGDLAGARPYYDRALKIRQNTLGLDHPDTAASLNNLGALYREMDNPAKARPYFQQALTILQTKLGPNHPETQEVQENLDSLP